MNSTGRVGCHAALAGVKACDRIAHRDDVTGELVPEDSGRNDHPRVVSAAKYFDVGTAGQRRAHADEDVARSNGGNGNPFQLHVLFSVKYGCEHVPVIHRCLAA